MTITINPSSRSVRRSRPDRRGFTLTELMISMSIAVVVVGICTSSLMFVVRGAGGIGNYQGMNMSSRSMLDNFASDARMAVDVNSATATSVSMDVYNSTGGLDTVLYEFDLASETLTRTVYPDRDLAAGTVDTLLEGVQSMVFTYYNMVYDSATRTLNPATNILEIKEIQLEALMKRNVLSTLNSNRIISARYMMRNKKVSI